MTSRDYAGLVIIGILIILIIYNLTVGRRREKKVFYHVVYNKENERFYFRDLPFQTLDEAFWLAYCGQMMSRVENIFYACLLKWELEGYVENYLKNGIYYSRVIKKIPYTNLFETKVFKHIFLLGAFKRPVKVSKIHFNYRLREDTLVRISYNKLKSKGIVLPNNILAINDVGEFELPESLAKQAREMIGLKNFLEDFTLIEEKTTEHITLYEMHLVYAILFGVADETEKELRKFFSLQSLAKK